LFITGSLAFPDEQQLLLVISNVIHRLLSSDLDQVSCQDDWNPGGIRRSPANPTAVDVFEYMEAVQLRGEFSVECNVFVMIYLMRSSVQLDKDNWDLAILCAYMVAQKFWDDNPLRSGEFIHLLDVGRRQHVSKKVLNHLEVCFLHSLCFNLTVTSDVYTRTYSELMQILPQIYEIKQVEQPITATTGAQLGLEIPSSPSSSAGLRGDGLWEAMPDLDLMGVEPTAWKRAAA
jgi:hypothetical protein